MGNVSFYDSFVGADAFHYWGGITALLCTDSYTFDAAHTLDDITPSECTDGSYARMDAVILRDDGSGAYGLFGISAFWAMTVANYRYVVFFGSGNLGDLPLFCVDAGSAQVLSNEVLTIDGTAFTLTTGA